MPFLPDPVKTPEELARGKRALVKEAAWASLVGALYGGVILVGFALELGATPFLIGLLAAIPFLAQVAQLPAIALVERMRQRRSIAVSALTISRLVILGLALIPFIDDAPKQLAALILNQRDELVNRRPALALGAFGHGRLLPQSVLDRGCAYRHM